MGSVYEVEHVELGKRFVLKALLSDLSQRADLVARLRNEQRALGRLEHPNIINVTDAGVTSANVPYFVMERLDGETLGARLRRSGYLPIGEALGIAAAVLDGLAAAHEIGVVHRDVKPPNIFLAHGKYPKILDFGVAKMMDIGGAITARGVAVGTPRYMSPEQASGEALDGRSDIYAVGLLLYESVVGKGPFGHVRDANELLLSHLSRPAPQLSASVGSVTRELDELAARLLAKKPAERPATAGEAAALLRSAAAPYAAQPQEAVAHASTVRLNVGAPPAAATRADGVAARRAWSAGEGATEDAKTLARIPTTQGPNDTLIVEHAPATTKEPVADAPTFHDYPGSAPLTRTEILSVREGPQPNEQETRTSVPVTPTDGSRTLDPVPLSSLAKTRPSARTKRRILVSASALVAFGMVAVILGRESSSREPRAAVVAAPASRPPVVASAVMFAAPVAAPSSVGDEAAPVGSAAALGSAAPMRPGSSREVASSALPTAPAPQKAANKPKSKSPVARIPDGLPSSGL
jgi:serine/threonine-protein kinase